MSAIGDLLFYNSNHAGVDDVIRAQELKFQAMVDQIPDSLFDRQSDDEVIAKVVEDARFDPLIVDFDGAVPNIEETTIEVRDSFGWDGSAQVPALRVTKTIPFTGDEGFWRLMAGQWSSSMPRGEVRGKKLIVGTTVRTERADEAKTYLDNTINEIKQYVPLQKEKVDAYNEGLPGRIGPYVEARRKRRGVAADLLSKL